MINHISLYYGPAGPKTANSPLLQCHGHMIIHIELLDFIFHTLSFWNNEFSAGLCLSFYITMWYKHVIWFLCKRYKHVIWLLCKCPVTTTFKYSGTWIIQTARDCLYRFEYPWFELCRHDFLSLFGNVCSAARMLYMI